MCSFVLLIHRLCGATFCFTLHCLFAVSKERSIISKMSLNGSFVLFPYETNSKTTLKLMFRFYFLTWQYLLSRHTFQNNNKGSRFVFISTSLYVRTDFFVTADLL